MDHSDVMTYAVLLLKTVPFDREFTPEEVVPSDGGLFLEQLLVCGRIGCRIYGLCLEPTKKAFPQNVHQDWVKKGVDGFEKGPNKITLPDTTSLRGAL